MNPPHIYQGNSNWLVSPVFLSSKEVFAILSDRKLSHSCYLVGENVIQLKKGDSFYKKPFRYTFQCAGIWEVTINAKDQNPVLLLAEGVTTEEYVTNVINYVDGIYTLHRVTNGSQL